MKRLKRIAVLLGLFVWIACSSADTASTIPLTIGGETLHVELARTEAEQQLGLMYRDSLPRDHGMLFIYRTPHDASYWMKNTFIPLSIAFLDKDKRIINIADMVPNDTSKRYRSERSCLYVLEVNQGYFVKHDIKVGEQASFIVPD